MLSLVPPRPDSMLWNHSGSSTMNTQFGSSAHEKPPLPCSASIKLHSNTYNDFTIAFLAYEMNEELLRIALLRKVVFSLFVFVPLSTAC